MEEIVKAVKEAIVETVNELRADGAKCGSLVAPQKAGHMRAVKGGFLFEGYNGIPGGETVYAPTLEELFAEIRAFFDDAK